ncbi:PREDICTED: serine-rich single-pass membrane protein 1 isoform X2 [Chinchilla lanigera]|uniref:Serine rich single-pass membrane protein 1 n=1 Tax=Chinchilla lanigera TaxID=34839 RepID=A0A8C2YNT5_CHILA|nr:PREDICTED: serine-rich single-pass membrane protein 1 isoform X2 [Chinchilla lanigera]
MGNLLSLFWERDPPPLPLSHYNPVQDYECQKDDSCGAVGSFLLWYFVILLLLVFLSRASVLISEDKQDEDRGTSAPVTKDTSYQRHSKGGCWDSTQMTKKSKQNQLFAITDSEVALVNAYLEQRRVRRKVNPVQPDSETTECDSEESNSGASSWKETESEHQPSLDSVQRRKVAERHQNLGSQQIRESPCPHCKAMRTNEWLIRHFLQRASEMVPPKEDTQEEVSMRSTRSSTRRDQQEVQ